MGLTPRDHTAAVLKRMNLAGSVPGNIDRNNDAQADNYGLTAARSSDASSFKMTGAPKAPHMGRPGRQAGGRIAGDLIRTRRTPQETARDIANEDSLADELGKDRGRATGGRIGRATGGSATAKDEYTQAGRTMMNEDASGKDQFTGGSYAPTRAGGGRVDRARGGRAKGKTTVNVIIGGDKHLSPQGPPPMPPPPMAAPGPVGPPPGGPPPMGPPGGAPMGPMGAPPPGAPPMLRARGGRIGKQAGGGMVCMPAGGMGGAAPRPFNMTAGGPGGPTPQPGFAGMGGGRMPMPIGGTAGGPGGPMPMPAGGPVGGATPQQMQAMRQAQMQAMQQRPPQMPQGMSSGASFAAPPPGGAIPPTGPQPMGLRTGGRIEIGTPGTHDYGKAGVKHGSTAEKYGGGSGLGRQERARHQK